MTSSRSTFLFFVSVALWVGWGLQAGEGEVGDVFAPNTIERQEELTLVPTDSDEAKAGSESGATANLPPKTATSLNPQHCDQDCCKHRAPGIFRWFRRKHNDCVRHCKRIRHFEPPPGTAIYAIIHKQIENGEAALMVFYRFDFLPGDSRLSPGGRRQLGKIARRLRRNSFPIRIEPVTPGDPNLDEERRKQVVKELNAISVPVTDDRVIIDEPPSRGLDGTDALLIDPSLAGLGGGSGKLSAPSGGAAGGAVPKSR
jgi:hypothetical protein